MHHLLWFIPTIITYVLTTARLNASGQRWVAELADFNFTIKYRPGKTNADADGLSRKCIGFEDYMSRYIQTVSQDAVAASQQCILVQQTEQAPVQCCFI